jgi:NAD(P)-dependent dehydrogenase (short-subunit alcohol dehydrogenase family)
MNHRPDAADAPLLITGCSSGIGRCLAEQLARRGYPVYAGLRRLAETGRWRGAGITPVELDLDDPGSIETGLARVLEHSGGRLYGLVNNAAYGQPGAVEDLRREVLRRQFESNLFGTHDLTRRVIPLMRAAGQGRIVQISSILGYIALPFRGAYVASKYALEGLSETLRLELHGSGIEVVLVEPGPVRSRFRPNAYRAYQEHIDPETSHFRHLYATVAARLLSEKDTPFTLPPEAVLRAVIHALESPRPRIRYRVTLPAHLFWALRRILPSRWLEGLLQRVGETERR